ncbi:MAG TPA: GNAT family N-acetyltransferase [Gemmatimonadaceae bacterium]|nr:GNAT family N-acetyltransferase [Gemmatimonadaceae bacterium]
MSIRAATNDDVPAIQSLIDRSARELSIGYYTAEQIDGAVMHVFGVDSQLIADRSYYVIEIDDTIVAAGGWSARRTLYGGDQMKDTEDPRLDPLHEAARIRAFFVDPAWARHGLARRLYNECARAALAAGFTRFELMATAPGVPAYLSLGFTIVERVNTPLPGGVSVPFARMTRTIE